MAAGEPEAAVVWLVVETLPPQAQAEAGGAERVVHGEAPTYRLAMELKGRLLKRHPELHGVLTLLTEPAPAVTYVF
jgi:hypothetical protein